MPGALSLVMTKDMNRNTLSIGDSVVCASGTDRGTVRGIGAGDKRGQVLIAWHTAGELYWECGCDVVLSSDRADTLQESDLAFTQAAVTAAPPLAECVYASLAHSTWDPFACDHATLETRYRAARVDAGVALADVGALVSYWSASPAIASHTC